MSVDVFVSYARIDDHDGAISAVCQALKAEVSMQSGRRVEVFQDTSITAGDRWRVAIHQGLSASAVMVCIVTPSFLASTECRNEFAAFTRDETRQRRANVVVPLYYLTTPLIEHSDERTARLGDEVSVLAQKAFAAEIVERQLTDIQAMRSVPPNEILRHEPTRRLLQRLGRDIAQHLSRMSERPPEVLVVNQERGPFRTIADALARAEAGATVLVDEGEYEGSIIIRKPVRIIGRRMHRRPVITATGVPIVTSTAAFCFIQYLDIRARRTPPSHALVVAGGRFEAANCRISGSEFACVVANRGTELRMWQCTVEGSGQSGILVDGGFAWILRCRILSNTHLGLLVEQQGVAYISDNVITRCRVGIQYADGATGRARRNRISHNEYAGLHITDGADPVVIGNIIESNDPSGHTDRCGGIFVYKPDHRDRPGRGRLIANQIRHNSGAGVEIRDGADPIVYGNVFDANRIGIWAHLGAKGTVARNRFVQNDVNFRIEDADTALRSNLEIPPNA